MAGEDAVSEFDEELLILLGKGVDSAEPVEEPDVLDEMRFFVLAGTVLQEGVEGNLEDRGESREGVGAWEDGTVLVTNDLCGADADGSGELVLSELSVEAETAKAMTEGNGERAVDSGAAHGEEGSPIDEM